MSLKRINYRTLAYVCLLLGTLILAGCSGGGAGQPMKKYYTLHISVEPSESGTVTHNSTYQEGNVVTLVPQVSSLEWKFDRWAGNNHSDVVQVSGKWSIIMDADKMLTAIFVPTDYDDHDHLPIASRADLEAIGRTELHTFAEGTALEVDAFGGLDKHYFMVSDLTLGSSFPMIGSAWNSFEGTFDGCGFVIRDGTINDHEGNVTGIFASLGQKAIITDVKLENIDVIGNDLVGGLVGINEGSIINVSVTAMSVSGRAVVGILAGENIGRIKESSTDASCVEGEDRIGALVGLNTGHIENSSAAGTVIGQWMAGGLVGRNEGILKESSATGVVEGERDIGGLVGENSLTGIVEYSVASGAVNGTASGSNWGAAGGLVGYNAGSILDSSSSGLITGQDNIGGLVGLNEGKVADSYATGNVEATGRDVGGLIGSSANERKLQSTDAPERIVENSYATGLVTGKENVGGLVGHNDGSISNSRAEGNVIASQDAGGLVGRSASSGYITSTYATGNVSSQLSAGGLVSSNAGTIERSYATGRVEAEGKGSGAGGLVSSNSSSGEIIDSYATGDVHGAQGVGGLAASNRGMIENSYAEGEVSGDFRIGGLVGGNYTGDSEDRPEVGTILNSYATGAVTGSGSVGGLVADNDGIIQRSYATGSVNAKKGAQCGGLVAQNNSLGIIESSYATGQVDGIAQVGGLVGDNNHGIIKHCYSTGAVKWTSAPAGGLVGQNRLQDGQPENILSSYYDQNTAGLTDSGKGEPKATAEMTMGVGFADWDARIWSFEAGLYPWLSWQGAEGLHNMPPSP